jgi:hypothetical protein
MITTISTCGCSGSTSMWRMVVLWIGGAETMASRFVTCESASDVVRMASSTSRRTSDSGVAGRGSSSAPRARGSTWST